MNRYRANFISRRQLLKMIACTASGWTLARQAAARQIVVVAAGSDERIAQIEWIPYTTGTTDINKQEIQRLALRLTTNSGVQGWADVPIETLPDASTATSINEILRDQSPDDLGQLWRQFYQLGLDLGTLAAVDLALWDLRGRIAETPVHAMLGTMREQAKTCLCTEANLGETTTYASLAQQCQASGVAAIKIRPYIEYGTGLNGLTDAGFPDKDMLVYQAVREAVGADYPCIAANQRTYAYNDALRVGQLLDELDFARYESPMPETEVWIDDYIALAEQLRVPICGPETDSDAYASRIEWLNRQACDMSRTSLYYGGFTACLQLASACEEAGVALSLQDVSPHAYPYLQLMGATEESLIPYFEIDSLSTDSDPLPGRVTSEPAIDDNGTIAIPQTPGMGLELDWTYIIRHRVR